MDLVTRFVIAGVIIIVAGLIGWLIQVGLPFLFKNATGQFSSTTYSDLYSNLPLIFLGVGVFVGVIYLIISVVHAAKSSGK